MEKYVLDYSETSYFKGLRILYPYIEEGLLYAQQNNIKDICVWTQGDWTKQNVNFDFLNGKVLLKHFTGWFQCQKRQMLLEYTICSI